jgi:hypothetical protein
MDQRNIEYRPYKYYRYFCPVLVGGVVVFGFLTFVTLSQEEIWYAIFMLMMGIVAFVCVKCIYDLSKLTFLFEPEGIRVINDRTPHRYVDWSEFSYAYFENWHRGHSFMILSPVKLSQDERSKYLRKSVNQSQAFFDGMLFISEFAMKDADGIKQMISEKVHNVE